MSRPPQQIYHRHHHHYPNWDDEDNVQVFPDSPAYPTQQTQRPVVSRPSPSPPTRLPVQSHPPRGSGNPTGGNGGLGVAAITFISVGGAVVLIVFLLCVFLTWRHSKCAKWRSNNGERTVGRAIQRSSFFPRFSKYRNQPIVVNYPDPYSHLPNYPNILTPYTFPSSSTITTGSQAEHLSAQLSDVPSYRATVY